MCIVHSVQTGALATMITLAGETVDIIHDSKKTADVFQSSEKYKKIVAKVCLAVKLWS